MTQATYSSLTVAILDADCYFVLGLESLLREHFDSLGMSIHFLPPARGANAQLLFQSVTNSMRFCRWGRTRHQQKVITVQTRARRRNTCISEHSIIDRSISVTALLLIVQHVMERKIVNRSPRNCPRCSRSLTRRELQILSILSRGNSHRQIAQLLGLDSKTVSAHKRNAMVKLGFSRLSDLHYWMKDGGLDQEIRELI